MEVAPTGSFLILEMQKINTLIPVTYLKCFLLPAALNKTGYTIFYKIRRYLILISTILLKIVV